MKTVYFEFINPPANVALWEVGFTNNPNNPDISGWKFSGFQGLGVRIKATLADDDLWVAFYAGISGAQATYGVAYQQSTIFVNGATYVWDGNTETLTLKGAVPPGGTPPPATGGGFTDFINKNALPIGIGAAVLVGMVVLRPRK